MARHLTLTGDVGKDEPEIEQGRGSADGNEEQEKIVASISCRIVLRRRRHSLMMTDRSCAEHGSFLDTIRLSVEV